MATTTAHHPPSGQHRDFKGMERLRLRAARMFEQGTSQAEVANQLGTSRQNAPAGTASGNRVAAMRCAPPAAPAADPSWMPRSPQA